MARKGPRVQQGIQSIEVGNELLVVLAAAPLKAELASNTRQRFFGPQSQAELEPVLERIRRQGYSRTSEFIPGITGLAAPVFGFDNTLALALVTLGYSVGFEAEEAKIRAVLERSAKQLSQRLGAEQA